MALFAVALVGSAIACGGSDDESTTDDANVQAPAPQEKKLAPAPGSELKTQGLRPSIRDGINGPCDVGPCGGGIKPSPTVWN